MHWARALIAAVVLLIIVAAVASWVVSSALLDPHEKLARENLKVLAVSTSQVTLEHTTASARPGTYGLDFSRGHAIITNLIGTTAGSVTRRLNAVRGRLTPGTGTALNPDVWQGDPQTALGIPFNSVSYPDPLGAMPAWLVGGRGTTWVIFVHGIDGSMAGGLRPLITLHALHLPTLLISYRNDAGAPRSSDHVIHLGMTEWQDLDAAARWALTHGARHLVLYGDSMGGAIVTRFMHQSSRARDVVGMVLDAPVLDWSSVIAHEASKLELAFMAVPVRWAISLRIGMDWEGMDEIARARQFHLPILLFQGQDDPLVPPSDSRRFADELPGLATYVLVPYAGHIESWNVDPSAYGAHLRTFLTPLLASLN
jgi:pimeloyl-ACP methyl ester carboxylesterase